MFAALLLGLIGSLTHCAGMCSGVMLLLGRGRPLTGWRQLVLHAGRLTTYAGLGAAAGALGYTVGAATGLHHHHAAGPQDATGPALPGVAFWGGALALLSAAAAVYMALAMLGRVPSPDLLLTRLTRWWGRAARGVMTSPTKTWKSLSGIEASAGFPGSQEQPAKASTPTGFLFTGRYLMPVAKTYLLGLFWGVLPCGLVLSALLLAAAAGSVVGAGLTMLAFGLGTAPLGLGIGWAGRQVKPGPQWTARLRPAAAIIVLLFGLQMTLRGLAAWGWVAHGGIGALPLW